MFATARLRHVTFERCRMDAASFRMAALEPVRMSSCDLRQTDFHEATVPGGQFLDCDLGGADVSRARFGGSELHGSRLDGLVGAVSLRDVVVDGAQAIELGQALLAAHGVVVTAEPTAT